MEKSSQAEPAKRTKKESLFNYLRIFRDAITPRMPLKNPDRRNFMIKSSGLAAGLMTSGMEPLAKWADQIKTVQESNNAAEIPESDFLTEDELAGYHTNIWNLPDVQLRFRKGAKESPLFKRLEKKGQHLDVILIDDYKVDVDSFTTEQKNIFTGRKATILRSLEASMQKVRDINAEEIKTNKTAKIQEYTIKKNELSQQKNGGQLSDARYEVEVKAIDYLYSRYLVDPPIKEDLETGVRVTGQTTNASETENGKAFTHSYVFLSIRNMPESVTLISDDKSESITIPSKAATYSKGGYLPDDAPNPTQSYIDPDKEFTVDMTLDEYVVTAGRTAGDRLRHEFQHVRGVIVEKDADVGALKELQEASSLFEEKQDDSLYWIVFETPEGQTITQNQSLPDTV